MNENGKYALIQRGGWGADPGKWTLFTIGRETPARVYQSPAKRAYAHLENYEDKAKIVGRFDAEGEARAFQATVAAVWDEHSPAVAAALEAHKAAEEEVRKAQNLRSLSTRRALAIARGEAPPED